VTSLPIPDELLVALIDALDHLDMYLMANWDEQQRRRVRERMAKINAILHKEHKARMRPEETDA
jgi:hypothetical protein